MPCWKLARERRAAQIGVEDFFPIVGNHGVQRVFKTSDSGVVDQNVETTEGAFDARGGVLELMEKGEAVKIVLDFKGDLAKT